MSYGDGARRTDRTHAVYRKAFADSPRTGARRRTRANQSVLLPSLVPFPSSSLTTPAHSRPATRPPFFRASKTPAPRRRNANRSFVCLHRRSGCAESGA